jgi:hypothetical protein
MRDYQEGNNAYGRAVAVDSSGGVYVTGASYRLGTFDAYTRRYSPSGGVGWSSAYNGGNTDDGQAIVADDNYVYVAGTTRVGGLDYYLLVKYNSSNGNEVWSKIGRAGTAYALDVDSSGDIYVTGTNYRTVKYNSSGDEIWNSSFDLGGATPAGLDIDSNGNIYITGTNNNNDYLTVRLDSSGDYVWNKTYDGGNEDSANDVAVSSPNSEPYVYVTGSSELGGDSDWFTIKYSQTESQDPSYGYVNVSITTTLSIDVIQEDVDFGEGAVTAGYFNATLYTNQNGTATQINGNWTLPNAYALEVRNTGNINCSLGISSSKTASSFLGGTNPEYQWKVSDKEAGSCSGGLIHGVWSDVNSSATACGHFSPINATDEIFIDFRLVVPYDANPSDSLVHKTDIITITASATA